MHEDEQANTDARPGADPDGDADIAGAGGSGTMTPSGPAGGAPFARPPRPRNVTRAGTVMVTLGIIGVAACTIVCLFALTLAFGVSSPNNGGTGLHWAFYAVFVPIAALITSLWVMQIICGVSVLRGRTWVRTPALIVTSVVLAGSLAPLLSRPSVPWSAGVALYAAATLWSLTLLMSRDVGAWCRRA